MKVWRPNRPTIAAPQLPERRSFMKRMFAFTAGGAALAAIKPREARADVDPFLGELSLVAFNFAPTGWAMCNGQLIPIIQNTALFALLGTQYGGDGVSTFALPDLRGRVPIHIGQGPGLTNYAQGETGGSEGVTMLQSQMPQHTHAVNASSANGTSASPAAGVPAFNASGVPSYSPSGNGAQMYAGMIATVGNSLPHENRQPYLALNWIICVSGIFPTRP
ncbi:MAG: phage tail protein [Candidatus Eiseniibacteriota bacterium]